MRFLANGIPPRRQKGRYSGCSAEVPVGTVWYCKEMQATILKAFLLALFQATVTRTENEGMPQHFDPRMPPVDQVVLRDILERQANERPDQPYALFDDGSEWSYSQTREIAIRTANALRTLGVSKGDRVISWLPNGKDALRVWFGLNYLGAVFVPINLSYKGRLLEHVLRNSEAKLIAIHADLLPRLAEIDYGLLKQVVVMEGDSVVSAGLCQNIELLPAEVLDTSDVSLPVLDQPIAPWNTQSIIYTSGTTGPSKGVLSSYMHLFSMSTSMQDLGATDRFVCNLPLFHVGGTGPAYCMLVRGGSIAVQNGFNTETFWPMVRKTGATSAIILASMAPFLLSRPPSPEDRNHTLRWVTAIPLNEAAFEFASRFGCALYTHFNMTEISMPICSERNPTIPGSAGKLRVGVSVRVVDENDCEVPVGTVGELVVRSDCPWAMNHGYNKNPEATAAAWRNGWFHTGDAFRIDANDNYIFVDRIKDALRRRGENISSFEIESEIMAFPGIQEVAVVGVPSEFGEDEVMAVIVPKEGGGIDPISLVEFLIPRVAHFMVPRFVRVVTQLPRTPTHKIQKHLLRAEGLSPDVWDREKAGIVVKAQRLSTASY